MILGRDLDTAGPEVLDRVVPAVMPERQLERPPAESVAKQLVTEADAERRDTRGDDLANGRDGPLERRWIAGPVGDKEPVRFELQDLASSRGRRQHRHFAAKRP